MSSSVLLVEDDQRLAEMLSLHLQELDCDTQIAADGQAGLELAQSGSYDLIILDRSLPKLEGLEVCKRIRESNTTVPILMLTALTEEFELVAGLNSGADDYISKPFSLAELVARVKALLRRTERGGADAPEGAKLLGEMEIDATRRVVRVSGSAVALTAKEFDLLSFLAATPGRVYSREEILEQVWGFEATTYDLSINTVMKRLRKKLGDNPREPRFIETVRGVGYRFIEQ